MKITSNVETLRKISLLRCQGSKIMKINIMVKNDCRLRNHETGLPNFLKTEQIYFPGITTVYHYIFFPFEKS